jgi:hypothetical protein
VATAANILLRFSEVLLVETSALSGDGLLSFVFSSGAGFDKSPFIVSISSIVSDTKLGSAGAALLLFCTSARTASHVSLRAASWLFGAGAFKGAVGIDGTGDTWDAACICGPLAIAEVGSVTLAGFATPTDSRFSVRGFPKSADGAFGGAGAGIPYAARIASLTE